MKEVVSSNLVEEDILVSINTLREVLNEMCYTMDEPNLERLIVSYQMDQLIVEYMDLKNKRD